MEQNLYSALVCFLNDSSKFRKKYKPDAGLLKTLHDRGRSIRLQDGRRNYGTKGVKVPTIDETTVVLQETHISEAGSHIQRLKTLGLTNYNIFHQMNYSFHDCSHLSSDILRTNVS